MNLNDFSYEENDRRYIKPEVSLNEQNAFIQNLRDTQGERNAQIQQQTHNLGTDVPSNIGGLNGSEAYFKARYQTPHTNSMVADLRAAAQAQALNTALNNELAKAKKRYQDAYRAAQNRSNGGNGVNGEVKFETVGDEYSLEHVGTEGELADTVNDKTIQRRNYYILGSNGERTPIRIYGSGNSLMLQTPYQYIEGGEGVNEWVKKTLGNGGRIMARRDDGSVFDISNGYHIQWGI